MTFTPRKVGSTVKTPIGFNGDVLAGVITHVYPVPQAPELVEYMVEWEDGKFPEEIWKEDDFLSE